MPQMKPTLNTVRTVLIALAALALMSWLDFTLGYEISIGPLYFALIAYVSWQLGTMAGMLTACLVSASRFWSDYASGMDYSSEWFRYETTAARLVVFLAAAYAMSVYRRTLEEHRKRVEVLRRMLPVCHQCGSVLGPDGKWHPFETLSRAPFPEVAECPDCLGKPPKEVPVCGHAK